MQELLEKLKETITKYNENVSWEKVEKAFLYALEAHKGQKRVSGEDYISHPVEVACILASLEMDTQAICAALLHDVVEDTEITLEDITELFGEDVAIMVDGVTKLGKIQYTNQEDRHIESLRKMFLAMAKDIRVIVIKLADRLHNMRTMKSMPEQKRREKSRETMEVYAPLAHRLGMSGIKGELEDLSLKYLDPVGYHEIAESIAQKKRERDDFINLVMDTLKGKLKELNIDGTVSGRAKHFYSIYRKMYAQNKSIEEIYDLFAVRIIVNSVNDCYAALGMVHELYMPIPMRFKDYIAMPKPNMYQSLHSTVIGPNGQPIEIQIRTWEMHTVAEKGIAAHWKYKEGSTTSTDTDSKLLWVRQLLEMQKEAMDEDDFMRTLKIDLFADEVFVFTPNGDVINLPAGATSIDFAFTIHSAIGYKMMGAKVNGKIVPIDHPLSNGDIVEILTSPNIHGPSRDWLKIVKTAQARNKINQWFKKERREENILRGKDMIDKELKRHSFSYNQLFVPEWVSPILKRYNLNSVDDLFASIGYGGLTANKIILRLQEDFEKNNKDLPTGTENVILPTELSVQSKKHKTSSHGIIVHGLDNCLIRLAHCCKPVPGDDIIGFITRGRGVSVHRRDCSNMSLNALSEDDLNRFIEVSWENEIKSSAYLIELAIEADDRANLLLEITSALSEIKAPIKSLNARTSKNNAAIIMVGLEITSTAQLELIVKKIRTLKGIYSVTRSTQ